MDLREWKLDRDDPLDLNVIDFAERPKSFTFYLLDENLGGDWIYHKTSKGWWYICRERCKSLGIEPEEWKIANYGVEP